MEKLVFMTNQKNLEDSLENKLNPFAQRYSFGKRLKNINKPTDRTEFQRDRDRILHTKAFRRMMHKTQIFGGIQDYYRTRLTHTIEVMQISRSIARILGVNEDLTEAIALGHDLGHTPFGHEGERTLNDILMGKDTLGNKIKKIDFGGFKHNFQTLRLVDTTGRSYNDEPGLNLTWQVREGMLKHTKFLSEDGNLLCNYPDFITKGLFLDIPFSVTIEGQIVYQADEIAQRAHDLDDGLRSGIIKLKDLWDDYPCAKDIFGSLENIEQISDSYVQRQELVRKVIRFFSQKLIEQSIIRLQKYWDDKENRDLFFEQNIVKEKLVVYHESLKPIIDALELFITQKVINSPQVNRNDGKAVFTIRQLFKAYLTNPRQLPPSTLNNMKERFERKNLDFVDLSTAKKDVVEITIRKWQFKSIEDLNNLNTEQKEDIEKHLIFVRAIADHLAGMTDNYANKEYRELYLPDC